MNSFSAESIADREIVTTRLFNASLEELFSAFSDPSHLARWWGPAGFTNTFHEFNLRPGGHWRFVMHGPDGTDYPNDSVFDEVVPLERIVFRHLDSEHEFQMTILFADEGGGSRMTWRMLHPTVEKLSRVKSFVADANEQNFDKLETELSRMAGE